MSQDTFPFAPGEETEPVEQEQKNSRKAVLVAGGVAAALVVGAGGWFLLGSGGGDASATAFVPHRTARPAVTVPKTVVKPAKKLPVAYKAQLGRDPFRALYVLPVAAPGGSAAVPVPAGGSGSVPAAGTGTTPGTTTPGTTTPGTTTPAGSTRYTLKLLAISKPSPQVRFTTWQVAGVKKTILPGQRFGKFGEVVVLAYGQSSSGAVDSAIIQVGDDSPIDVKIGEAVSIL